MEDSDAKTCASGSGRGGATSVEWNAYLFGGVDVSRQNGLGDNG